MDNLGSWSLAARGVTFVMTRSFRDIFGRTLKCRKDLCFSESGIIVDPISIEVEGRFEPPGYGASYYDVNAVVPEVEHHRVYFVWERNLGMEIASYYLLTLKQAGWLRLTGVRGAVNNAVLWGDDRLAFADGAEICLVPLSLVDPQLPPRLLNVSSASFDNSPLAGSSAPGFASSPPA